MTSKDKTKSLVNKATTDDRNPPSGYLLKELAARTMQISECQTIEDLIVKKLTKNKPYVKYKALRVVKFLCETGSANWRRAWQRNTDKLRDAQQFRGPPDPIYGDAPYQQVRKAAKDAMQAVFAQQAVDNTPIRSKIKGFGGDNAYSHSDSTYKQPSSTFGSGSSGTFGGSSLHKNKAPSAPSRGWGKQMPGHGNTNYKPNVTAKTFKPLSTPSYTTPAHLSGSPSHSTGKLDTRGKGKKRKKHTAGGVWGNDGSEEEEEEDYTQYEAENSYSNSRNSQSGNQNNQTYSVPKSRKAFGGNIKKKKNVSSGQYEKRWVDDIVKSGGVGCKIVDLPKFVTQFENLSKNHVLEYLDEKLEDSAWQKRGKALALIEALLKGKSSDDVVEYFTQSPDNVQALQNAKKSILRKKANAVMEYIDVEDEEDDEEDEEEDESPDEPQVQQEQSMGDLLGGVGGQQEEEEDDMFGDMETHETEETGDLIDFGQTQEEPAASANTGSDLMDIMGDSIDNATQKTAQPVKKAYTDIFADITGGTQPPPNTSTNAANGGDLNSLFGGGGGGGNKANGNSANTGASATSAFGFDIGGGSQPPANTTQKPTQNTASSGASAFGFDLNSGGGNKQATPQQKPDNSTASSMNSSAFGFDLGGNSGGNAMGNNMGNNMNNSMGNMNNMNQPQAPMMTTGMMAQNNQTQMNMMNQMSQMQQMQNMMQQMSMGQMNPNMMAQMQQNMMNMNNMNNMNNMMPQQQPNLFQQAMQGVNAPQQHPMQRMSRGSNDPFSGLTGGSQAAQTTQQPTQPPPSKGPDPFADLGLGSMK